MGFDNDCIVNIQSLAGEYFCAVCRTLVYPNEAIQAPCTHLYCKPCLTYVVSTTHACPYDGYRVTEADSKPLLESNKTLADTIGKIQVHCLFYRTGCAWEGSLSECTSHCSSCSFGESAVLCNRCGIQLKHRQVQEHAQNCSGVQSQPVQDSTSTSTVAATTTVPNQTAVQAGGPVSQAVPQATSSQAPASVVSSQEVTTQPQVTQGTVGTVLTPEQYQQQLQYQQYYQQYPGYDPYQQNYQYYYQYPHMAQQYQQPQTQAYPQAYGQPQAQVYGQTQPLVQGQQQVPPLVPSQGAQPPLQPHAQIAANAQPLVPPTGQAQPQVMAQGQAQPQMPIHGQTQPQMGQAPVPHAPPYNQSQPLSQVQPYTQPQPAPQQQFHVPQYPNTHPQMQQPHVQNYPQSQTQHYPPPQSQVLSQPHSQPNMPTPVQPQQPFPPSAQLQTPNTVSGYQSYPQPHPQAHAGAPQPSLYSNQGQYPVQTAAQMRPPQSHPTGPSQGQPPTGPSQGQPPTGPTVYPQAQAQQPGYPIQQRPSVQAPQQYGQQQSFPGQGPFMQHQPSMPAQLHAQGPSQMPPQSQQNYGQPPNVSHNAGRPMGVQAVAHPYGHAGAGQIRPPQSNQNYPIKNNNQLSGAQSQRVSSGENSRAPMLEKGVHDHNNSSKEVRDTTSNQGSKGDEIKLKAKNNSVVSADGNDGESYLSGSKQKPEGETMVDNHVQEAKPKIKGGVGEDVSKTPSGGAGKSSGEDHGDALRKAEVQDLKSTPKHVAGSSAPPSDLRKPHVQSQVHGANSYPSTDHGRNQLQSMPYGQHKLDNSSNQFRPQGPGQAPSRGMPFENPSGSIHGPGSSGSLGRPGDVNYYQDNLPPRQAGHPQNSSGDPLVGPTVTAHRPGASRYEIEMFEAQRSGHFDGRQPDSHPHGPIGRNSFGPGPHGVQPGPLKFGAPSVHDPMSAPSIRDERAMPFGEEHLKRFPPREFEDDFRKFTRPPHLDAGPSSNYGMPFPSSGPLEHESRMPGGDGLLRPFDKGPHGFDHGIATKMDGVGPSRLLPSFHPKDGERARAFLDGELRRADFSRPDFSGPPPGPGFGRHHMDGLPPRSPGRDYPGFPSGTVGPYGDVGGNEPRPFEGSKPYNFPSEPFGKPTHESRFPVPPRGGHDVHGNFRPGEHLAQNQDFMPSHLRRGGHMGPPRLHLGEESVLGRPGGLSRLEPPLGNFPPHVPFGDSFGGERPGHLLQGEPGFRSRYGFPHHGHGDGFHPREMDHFDNPRKRKPGSIMCRICQVECGTVEGLDLHSQSKEHQLKARDMVLSIKQHSKKKQKLSKDQASVEEGRDGGRPKNSGFQGRGIKR